MTNLTPLVPPTPPTVMRGIPLWQNGEDMPCGQPFTRQVLQAAADYLAVAKMARYSAVGLIVIAVIFILSLQPALWTTGGMVILAYLLGVLVCIGAGVVIAVALSPLGMLLESLVMLLGGTISFVLLALHYHGSSLPVPNVGIAGSMVYTGITLFQRFLRFAHLCATPPTPAERAAVGDLLQRATHIAPTDPRTLVLRVPRLSEKPTLYRGLLDGDYLLLANGYQLLIVHWSEITITREEQKGKKTRRAVVTLWGCTATGPITDAHLEAFQHWQTAHAVPLTREDR